MAAGQNAAYDQFNNQIQLYYRGKGKNVMWYDPVFQARALAWQTKAARSPQAVQLQQLMPALHAMLQECHSGRCNWQLRRLTDTWGHRCRR